MPLDGDAFAQRFKALIGTATQIEVAARLRIKQQLVSRYLRGRIPDPENLVAISAAYNVTINWLLTGAEPQFLSEESYAAELGRRLMEIRKDLGVTRPLLAESLGLDLVGDLERWEQGKEEISLRFLRRLSDEWNVNLNWLRNNEGPRYKKYEGVPEETYREVMRLRQERKIQKVWIAYWRGYDEDVIRFLGVGHRPGCYFIFDCDFPSSGEWHAAWDCLYDLCIEDKEMKIDGVDFGDDETERDRLFEGNNNPRHWLDPLRSGLKQFKPCDRLLPTRIVERIRERRRKAVEWDHRIAEEEQQRRRENLIVQLRQLSPQERRVILREIGHKPTRKPTRSELPEKPS